MARDIEVQQSSPAARLPAALATLSLEDLQRRAQLQTIALNEDSWRRRQTANDSLEQATAAFLTVAQLSMLAQMNRDDADALRRWVENARVQAGPDPAIPDKPGVDSLQPLRMPVDAKLKLDIRMIVNRSEPKTVTLIGAGGEAMSLDAGDELFVEVTPTAYDDDSLDVHLRYYEEGASKRRRLAAGSITHIRPEDPWSRGGESGTVVIGTKGYAVLSNVRGAKL